MKRKSPVACAHTHLEASLDRWQECHWHLHQMEGNYHLPDAFRYALNAFIRAIADVPELLTKNLEGTRLRAALSSPGLRNLKRHRCSPC